jgi:hypothetical protein
MDCLVASLVCEIIQIKFTRGEINFSLLLMLSWVNNHKSMFTHNIDFHVELVGLLLVLLLIVLWGCRIDHSVIAGGRLLKRALLRDGNGSMLARRNLLRRVRLLLRLLAAFVPRRRCFLTL